MKLIKFFFILLLLLNSCISILTANEYRQNLNFQLTSKYSQQDVLSRKIIVNDSVKLVISEKPYEKPVIANRFEYLPYGETWITEGDGNNNPKYNSQELDKETNFYFYNARSFRFNCQSRAIPETNEVAHYDPEIARFVTADTVIDGEDSVSGWNRYMYVAGNFISYRDPTGHGKKWNAVKKYLKKSTREVGEGFMGIADSVTFGLSTEAFDALGGNKAKLQSSLSFRFNKNATDIAGLLFPAKQAVKYVTGKAVKLVQKGTGKVVENVAKKTKVLDSLMVNPLTGSSSGAGGMLIS